MADEQVLNRPTPIIGRRTGMIMAVAFVLANASNYTFQVIAGRSLTPDEDARAIAAGEVDPSPRRVDGLTMSALKVSLAVGLVVVFLSPLLANVLRVGVLPVILLAIYIVPSCLDSIAAGRLQGSRRFGGLAIYSTGQAATKVTAAALVLIAGARVVGLLAAVITGAAAVALVGLRATSRAGSVQTHVLGSESRRSFAALALFWLILSIDVPLARIGFEGSDAGLYTAGAVLGKAVLWLPIVVTQVVFPSLADGNTDPRQARRLVRNAGLVVVVLAVAAVGALFLLGPTVYSILYGERYEAAADVAWKIGLAMIPLALVNLLMFQLLARRNGSFLKWFVMFAVIEITLLLVFPQSGGWYAATLGLVGTGLLLTVLLAARTTGMTSAQAAAATPPWPSDGLSLS